MVAFKFDPLTHFYSRTINAMRTAYNAAEDSLAEKQDELKSQLKAYEDGGKFIGEVIEDNGRSYVLWHQGQIYEGEIDQVDQAALDLRKAFIPAIYHAWERLVKKASKGEIEQVRGRNCYQTTARKLGWDVPDRLESIRHITNVIKHNSKTAGPELEANWPEILNDRKTEDWYSRVSLRKEDIEAIFDIVLDAGPKNRFNL